MSQLRACTNTSGLYIHTYIAAITAAGGLGPELKAENKDCNNYSDAPLTVPTDRHTDRQTQELS